MKICFVHDYLNQFGGAERTLKAMHEIWPDAPIYTTLVDWNIVDLLGIPRGAIRYPKWLNFPLISRFYKYFTLFYPLVFEGFALSEFDFVVSTSANFSKGIVTGADQVHVNYCFTPPRFLYHLPTESNKRGSLFWRLVLAPVDFCLRMWDYVAAQRVDHFIADSKTVARRISKFYGRRSVVIYPPVDVKSKLKSMPRSETFRGQKLKVIELKEYYLVVSRLSAYKNIDLIIRACSQLNRPLKIVGTGPEEGRLKKLAREQGGLIEFLGFVPDEQLADLYARCKAFALATSDEDFGIVPVEAMGFGRPVIALRSGGVTETVLEGETGIFFDSPTVESLVDAIKEFESREYFQTEDCFNVCRRHAEKFGKERFQKEFREYVESVQLIEKV
ncbi:glycosyltransferase [Patescibacteria group bacterium]|nr:glycosyltransferase [Patescibacteria group bacterium]